MSDNTPTVIIDTMDDSCGWANSYSGFWDGYIDREGGAAFLPTSMSWDELWILTNKISGGNIRKEMRKTAKKGYYCEQITIQEHLQDMYEINMSKTIRQGKPMHEEWYRYSVEELRRSFGSPSVSSCPYHHYQWFGVFTKEKKMVGYIKFNRVGQLGVYGMILGHGDYLKDGIIYFLHFYIQKLIRESDNERYKGIAGTAYHAMLNGTKGLIFWKHKAGFAQYHIVKVLSIPKPIPEKKEEEEKSKSAPHP